MGFTQFFREVLDRLPGVEGTLISYTFEAKDFAAGWSQNIQGPDGKAGIVMNIRVSDVEAAFAGDDGDAQVQVGDDSGNPDDFATAEIPSGTEDNYRPSVTFVATIPADTVVSVTGVPAGENEEAPAGVATVTVSILWFS